MSKGERHKCKGTKYFKKGKPKENREEEAKGKRKAKMESKGKIQGEIPTAKVVTRNSNHTSNMDSTRHKILQHCNNHPITTSQMLRLPLSLYSLLCFSYLTNNTQGKHSIEEVLAVHMTKPRTQ